MAKIDSVKDLPDWFDLVKYSGVESFSAKDWFRELSFRQQLLTSNPIYPSNNNRTATAEDWVFWRQLVSVQALRLRATPINRNDHASHFIVQGKGHLFTTYSDGLIDTRLTEDHGPVREISLKSLIDEAIERRKILGDQFEATTDSDSKRACLSIDLSASNASIKQAFDLWIKRAREDCPLDSQLKRPLHDRWGRYGLLPYIDLLIWAMETDTHIPDRVMSAAISSYNAGEENLRKTTSPLASRLMRDLSELKALAATERQ
ncbi:MAG: DUF6387 family protein [Pseudomonas marincola]|uniref:DUF6387 family protein n=1 Tax=Pseudomonas marincola TaxID=437900 RepID=UPI0030011F75